MSSKDHGHALHGASAYEKARKPTSGIRKPSTVDPCPLWVHHRKTLIGSGLPPPASRAATTATLKENREPSGRHLHWTLEQTKDSELQRRSAQPPVAPSPQPKPPQDPCCSEMDAASVAAAACMNDAVATTSGKTFLRSRPWVDTFVHEHDVQMPPDPDEHTNRKRPRERVRQRHFYKK